MKDLADSILGCIMGGAIGDAAGASAEGKPEPIAWRDAHWHLTDDTQLTLATCEALTQEDADPALIAASFLRWFRAGRLAGLGASTLKALRDLRAGAHWALAGRPGEFAAGNGAAMRIAPLAFCVDPQTSYGRRLIRDVSRITHHSDEAYAGALAVALAIRGAAQDPPHVTLERVIDVLPDSAVRDRLLLYAALPSTTGLQEAATRLDASGHVADSIPFALFAASRLDSLGFVEMLHQVICAGGDADTNASLAGQVAGTRVGLGGLPPDLLGRLPEADLVAKVAQDFSDAIGRRCAQ